MLRSRKFKVDCGGIMRATIRIIFAAAVGLFAGSFSPSAQAGCTDGLLEPMSEGQRCHADEEHALRVCNRGEIIVTRTKCKSDSECKAFAKTYVLCPMSFNDCWRQCEKRFDSCRVKQQRSPSCVSHTICPETVEFCDRICKGTCHRADFQKLLDRKVKMSFDLYRLFDIRCGGGPSR
jgi:hypothetical protein